MIDRWESWRFPQHRKALLQDADSAAKLARQRGVNGWADESGGSPADEGPLPRTDAQRNRRSSVSPWFHGVIGERFAFGGSCRCGILVIKT